MMTKWPNARCLLMDETPALRPQNILRVSLDGRPLVLPLKTMLLFPSFLEDLHNFALGVFDR